MAKPIRLERRFHVPLTEGESIRLARQHLTNSGYVPETHTTGLEFTRGSVLRSQVSLSPKNWKTKVTLIVRKDGEGAEIHAIYVVDTTGQHVMPSEIAYWEAEADRLEEGVLTGRSDTNTVDAAERETRKAAKTLIIVLLAGALFAAIGTSLLRYVVGFGPIGWFIVGILLLGTIAVAVREELKERRRRRRAL